MNVLQLLQRLALRTDYTHCFGDVVMYLTRAKDTKLLQFSEEGHFPTICCIQKLLQLFQE